MPVTGMTFVQGYYDACGVLSYTLFANMLVLCTTRRCTPISTKTTDLDYFNQPERYAQQVGSHSRYYRENVQCLCDARQVLRERNRERCLPDMEIRARDRRGGASLRRGSAFGCHTPMTYSAPLGDFDLNTLTQRNAVRAAETSAASRVASLRVWRSPLPTSNKYRVSSYTKAWREPK